MKEYVQPLILVKNFETVAVMSPSNEIELEPKN